MGYTKSGNRKSGSVAIMNRSEIMRRIRSTDTKPEKSLRRALWHRGRRFRKNYNVSGIRVDIAFPKAKVAVMVDGCFWHGCPIHYRRPKGRQDYWDNKLIRNLERDRRNEDDLKEMGWQVVRIWEHEPTEIALQMVISVLESEN